MIKTLTLLLVMTTSCFASTKSEINQLMYNYLTSLDSKNQKKMETLVSYSFLRKLQAQKVFKGEKKNTKPTFDIKIQKANHSKSTFLVNIKDKKKTEYNDYWYVIKKVNTRFLIEGMRFIEVHDKK